MFYVEYRGENVIKWRGLNVRIYKFLIENDIIMLKSFLPVRWAVLENFHKSDAEMCKLKTAVMTVRLATRQDSRKWKGKGERPRLESHSRSLTWGSSVHSSTINLAGFDWQFT